MLWKTPIPNNRTQQQCSLNLVFSPRTTKLASILGTNEPVKQWNCTKMKIENIVNYTKNWIRLGFLIFRFHIFSTYCFGTNIDPDLWRLYATIIYMYIGVMQYFRQDEDYLTHFGPVTTGVVRDSAQQIRAWYLMSQSHYLSTRHQTLKLVENDKIQITATFSRERWVDSLWPSDAIWFQNLSKHWFR